MADLPARLDAELRDGRTLVDLHDGGIDTKARERIDDELRARGVVVLAITAGLGLLQEFNGRQLPATLFLEGELLGLLLAVGIRQVVPGFLPRVVGLGFRGKGKLILHQGRRDGWRDAIDMGRSRRDPGAEDDGGGFEGHRGARSGSFEDPAADDGGAPGTTGPAEEADGGDKASPEAGEGAVGPALGPGVREPAPGGAQHREGEAGDQKRERERGGSEPDEHAHVVAHERVTDVSAQGDFVEAHASSGPVGRVEAESAPREQREEAVAKDAAPEEPVLPGLAPPTGDGPGREHGGHDAKADREGLEQPGAGVRQDVSDIDKPGNRRHRRRQNDDASNLSAEKT